MKGRKEGVNERVGGVVHILDYPPRGTGCGLYYPGELFSEGFGTYYPKEVTCRRCLGYMKKRGVAK